MMIKSSALVLVLILGVSAIVLAGCGVADQMLALIRTPAPTPTATIAPATSSTTRPKSTPRAKPDFATVREFRYQGEDAAKKGDYDKAIENFTHAIELDPRNSDRMNAYSYLERGDAYYQKGSYDQAVSDYNRLIALDPRFQGAYHFRARVYEKTGKLDLALADYSKAIELDKGYTEVYKERGLLYRKLGQGPQATADFRIYLSLAPNASDWTQVKQWIAELGE